MYYTVFDVTSGTISKQHLVVTYVRPTCFDLYKVIVKEMYSKGIQVQQCRHICVCLYLKHNIVDH